MPTMVEIATKTAPQSAEVPVAAVVGFLVLVELCSGILQGSMPSVTPLIGSTLHVSSGDLNWVASVTLLVSGVSVPLLAKLGDKYGHRRMIRATMVVVAAGSVLTAVADDFALLLVGRALTGVLGAWLPLEFAIVRDRIHGGKAGAAVGLLVGALTLGTTLGPLGVGLLSEKVTNVHALLWFPAACILLCVPVAFFLIPESATRSPERIDWPGAALLSVGLATALLALGHGSVWGWGSAATLALFATAAGALTAFVVVELRAAEPLIDLRMMAGRSLAPLYILSFTLGFAFFGAHTPNATFMATPSELGFGFGYGTLGLALMGLPVAVGALAGSATADRLVAAWGARPVVIAAFAAISVSFLSMVGLHEQPWQFATASAVTGIGVGLVLGSLPPLIMAGLPADKTGIGTGLYNTLKPLAGSISGAIFATVMNQHLLELPVPGPRLSAESGYYIVWAACAGVALAGAAIALTVRARPRESPQALPVPALAAG